MTKVFKNTKVYQRMNQYYWDTSPKYINTVTFMQYVEFEGSFYFRKEYSGCFQSRLGQTAVFLRSGCLNAKAFVPQATFYS